jgi:hypothetical protein
MKKTTPKLTRRDALKVLGAAAGASALANLPSKWRTPVLTAGVLPAHAQSSPCYDLIITWTQYESGGPYYAHVESPLPSETTESSSNGYARWYCGTLTTCVPIVLILDSHTFYVQATSWSGSEYHELVGGSPTLTIYFDPGSGQVSTQSSICE